MAAPGIIGSGRRGKRERVKVSKEGWKTARAMLKYVRPYRSTYYLGIFFLVLGSLVTLGFPYMLGDLINSATGNREAALMDALEDIDQIALGLGILIAAQMLFSFLRVYTFSLVTQKTMADIRFGLFERLMFMPITFFEQRRVGELTSRITADVQQLQQVLSVYLAEFLRQVVTLVGGIAWILFTSPQLTLFMLAVFPPVVLITVVFGRFIRKHSKRTQDDLADTNVLVEESLHNISVVKSFTNEIFELGRYRQALKKVVANALKADLYRGLFISFIIFALFGTIILVIWYGAGMVQDGDLKIGHLFSFILFMVFIGGSLGGLPDVYSQILKAVGATERLKEILDEEEEPGIDKNQQEVAVNGHVQYQNVRFSYPTRPESEVLKGISLEIKPGEKVALAGSSGAGKSTITSLLMRFYDVSEGSILVDGKPLSDYAVHAIRAQMGVVPQEVILFGGTIRENIAYGRLKATEEEIRDAARQANALDFIEEFPEGFDTVVGDRGVKLSGGQRQRIAIARAILRDAPILLLDEATSALDAESERAVQDAVNVLAKDRTTLIVAHRLATVKMADRIVVMDQGRIVAQGPHDQLVAEGGLYARLAKLQFTDGLAAE